MVDPEIATDYRLYWGVVTSQLGKESILIDTQGGFRPQWRCDVEGCMSTRLGCISLREGLYNGVQASSLVDDGQWLRWFKVDERFGQGCPLLPLLYSIYDLV